MQRFGAENRWGLVGDEAADIQVAEAVAAFEVGEFYKESVAFDRGAKAFEQPPRRTGGTARSKQVVDDEDAVAVADGVCVDFQRICPVFERVLFLELFARQLAGLAHGNKTGADGVSKRRTKHVAPCFYSDDVIDIFVLILLDKQVYRRTKAGFVGQERGNVSKENPGNRKVRDGPDQRLYIHGAWGSGNVLVCLFV